ncbi:hypothetical protein SDC9_168217 [bioreactor metagenome]|uniref:Uncharacterized protein n=1 Tax=bioreactor metagenome TaxID=1076179 RepID=A0A645G1X6_9ZZZZ
MGGVLLCGKVCHVAEGAEIFTVIFLENMKEVTNWKKHKDKIY